MATTLADWANNGTTAQTKTTGNWTPSAFNTGKFRWTMTFTAASTGSPWRPGGLTYWGVITTNDTNGGGVWLKYNPTGTEHSIIIAGADDGNEIANALKVFTWAASNAPKITVDQSSASATVKVENATTGNGTSSTYTRENILTGATLTWGAWGGGGFALPASWGTESDIDDGVDSTQFERSATSSAAADIAIVAKHTHERTAAIATAAAIATLVLHTHERTASSSAAADVATVTRHAYNRAAASSVAADILTVARQTHNRSASSSAAAAIDVVAQDAISRTAASSAAADVSVVARPTRQRSASSSAVAAIAVLTTKTSKRSAASAASADVAVVPTVVSDNAFGVGVSSSAIATFGHSTSTVSAPGGYLPGGGPADADGRTPAAVETHATGSSLYVAIGRPDAATESLSDNKGNSYTQRAKGPYEPAGAAAWETAIFTAMDVVGGANHIVTAPSIVSDELTLGWSEILKGHYFVGYTTALHAAGATQSITIPATTGPAVVFVDWFGDGPTTTPEGALLTVTMPGDWDVVDSRLVNHTDGWIQWKRWKKTFAAAQSGTSVTTTPGRTEGARLWAAAFQEAPQIDRSAASSAAAAIDVVARKTCNRTASSSAPAAIAVLERKSSYRSAASAAAFDIATVARRTMARSAPSSQALTIDTVPRRLMQRAAAVATAADILVVTRHTLNRGASSSAAADIAVLADQSGTLNRAATSEAAAEIAVVPRRTANRSASSTVAADIAAAPARTGHSIERSAASSVAANIAVVPARTSHAPPAPVTSYVVGYADPDPSTV